MNFLDRIPFFKSIDPSQLKCGKDLTTEKVKELFIPYLTETNNNALIYSHIKKHAATIKQIIEKGDLPSDEKINTLMKYINHLNRDASSLESLNKAKKNAITGSENENNTTLILEFTKVKKKLDLFKLPLEYLLYDYKGLRFLIDADLIPKILGFQNSTQRGKDKNPLQLNNDNQLEIRKNGELTSVDQLKNELQWSKNHEALVSKNNIDKPWTYLSGTGLTQLNRFDCPVLVHVEEITQEELDEILAQAKTYSGELPKEDEGKRDCVLHTITNPRKGELTTHGYFRLFTSDRKVYSIGLNNPIPEQRYTDGYSNKLASINGKPIILDYEEFRNHEGRITFAIPTTTKRVEQTLKTVEELHRNWIRFSVLKQNCIKLDDLVLKMNGVESNCKISGHKALGELLPRFKETTFTKWAYKYTNWIRNTVNTVTPQKVNKLATFFFNIIMFIPLKIETLLLNLLVINLGGTKGSPLKSQSCSEQNEGMSIFKAIQTNGIRDLFSNETLQVYSASQFVKFQLAQSSTFVSPSESGAPNFGFFGPKTRVQEIREEKLRSEFKKIYS
ncbi:hypothetical protein N9Y92_00900 [Chlamydiales bacterium]|nr:hypothetical protein [Chlamydiales bacterium]